MSSEPRIPGLRRVLRIPGALRRGRGTGIERDIDDEISFHVESRMRELVERGESEGNARRHAEAEFGDLRASRRELARVDRRRRRRERARQVLAAVAQDVRYAMRSLRRSRAYTITAVSTLAIGIGAAVAIFALVNGVLLRPLPFGHPDRLVGAWHDMPAFGLSHQPQTGSTYFLYQRLTHTIDGIGIYREADVNVDEPDGTGEPQRLPSASITATLMPVLQVAPVVGRAFTADDDRPRSSPTVIISNGMWHARFGANRSILGRKLDVN